MDICQASRSELTYAVKQVTDPVDELWHGGVLGVAQHPAGVAGQGAGHPPRHRSLHCLHRGVQNLGSRGGNGTS